MSGRMTVEKEAGIPDSWIWPEASAEVASPPMPLPPHCGCSRGTRVPVYGARTWRKHWRKPPNLTQSPNKVGQLLRCETCKDARGVPDRRLRDRGGRCLGRVGA